MEEAIREKHVDSVQLDRPLLILTIESIINTHVLSVAKRRGRDAGEPTEPQMRARTKAHVQCVILALTGAVTNSRLYQPE
jgi:hypothetical protein